MIPGKLNGGSRGVSYLDPREGEIFVQWNPLSGQDGNFPPPELIQRVTMVSPTVLEVTETNHWRGCDSYTDLEAMIIGDLLPYLFGNP